MRAWGLAATIFILAGCSSRSTVEPVDASALDFRPVLSLNRDVDILFVIDDSSSMAEEQASLTAGFSVFTSVLEAIEGGLPNVHIGVVSTDVGGGPFAIEGCEASGDNGALRVGDTSCRPIGQNYISDESDDAGGRITNYPGTLADAFTCNAALGTTGCGFEQPLESMRRALDGSNGFNAGFLRDTAYLAVIFFTDEDDCSTENTQMFDTSQNSIDTELGYLHSFRCFEFGVACATGNDDPRAPGPRTGCFPREDSPYMHGVQEYVDFLNGLKDDDDLIMVANIAGDAEPVAVGPDPELPERPELVPSCTSTSGQADPAVRLDSFAQQFPDRNTFTSICNEDLSDGLELIAQRIARAFETRCIVGLPADIDPATPGLQVECIVSDVLNPNTDLQEEWPRPYCDRAASEDGDPGTAPASTNLPCWHLFEDRVSCAGTETGLRLIVERPGGLEPPPGSHVRALCGF